MYRQEFLNEITNWDELKDFCDEHECPTCDDIYDNDDKNAEIDWDISEYGSDYSWCSLRDLLNEIPVGYVYYRKNAAFEWVPVDDDFEEYKNYVCEYFDDHELWDEEETVDGPLDDFFIEADGLFEESDDPIEDEEFSVGDLIDMCSAQLATIQQNSMRKIEADKEEFDRFIDVNIPKVIK